MKYSAIVRGGPASSVLGFGCGSIMGRVGRSQSLRAIAAALDAGITHFDVARSYGSGDAEALLGAAVHHKRQQIVIASKFGQSAPSWARALRHLRPAVRLALGAVSAARPLVRAAAQSSTGAAAFSTAAAGASLDASLKALRTDYLDILFLHEFPGDRLASDLTEFLDRQVQAGKIRAYGVASGIETIAALQPRYPSGLVYQFRNGVCERNIERLGEAGGTYVTHSPLHGAVELLAAFRSQPDLLRRLGRSTVGPAEIHHLMLAWALSVEPVGVVLCSMLDPRHLRANVEVVERPAFSSDQIMAFSRIAADACAAGSA